MFCLIVDILPFLSIPKTKKNYESRTFLWYAAALVVLILVIRSSYSENDLLVSILLRVIYSVNKQGEIQQQQ